MLPETVPPPEVRAAVAALSPEDRELLAAVQTSPFKLTAPEQFKEFAANICLIEREKQKRRI